jgi:hypothetical protein
MAILHRHFRYDLSVSLLRIRAERTHNNNSQQILNFFYGGRMADITHRSATQHSPNDGG